MIYTSSEVALKSEVRAVDGISWKWGFCFHFMHMQNYFTALYSCGTESTLRRPCILPPSRRWRQSARTPTTASCSAPPPPPRTRFSLLWNTGRVLGDKHNLVPSNFVTYQAVCVIVTSGYLPWWKVRVGCYSELVQGRNQRIKHLASLSNTWRPGKATTFGDRSSSNDTVGEHGKLHPR